jgi:hypothetical protein
MRYPFMYEKAKLCRANARRCFAMAREAHDEMLVATFNSLAHKWMRLASELEAAERLLRNRRARNQRAAA